VLEKANELAALVNPLTGFDTLGLTSNSDTDLTRRSFVEGTPPVFMTEVFDAAAAPDLADEQSQAERQAVQNQVAGGISQDIFEAFANDLQIRTEVRIDQATLNALNAQLQ